MVQHVSVPKPGRDRPPNARQTPTYSWTIVNFWLDGALGMTFLSFAWVTIVIRYVFPPVTHSAGWRLWGLDIDQWIGCQVSLLAIFSLGILIHLMLHWSWICGVFHSKIWSQKQGRGVPDDGPRTIYGVGLLVLVLNLIGLLLGLAAFCIESPE